MAPFSANRLVAFLLVIYLSVTGCERASLVEADSSSAATLGNIQSRIFDTNCALSGCHAGANPQLGMSLEDGLAFGSIVNVQSQEVSGMMRVNPGNPEQSYLLKKVRGDADIVAAQMPLGRSALSDEDVELIRQWIADGALDN